MTVRDFWERWTTDPLFARPKDSTNIHNRERTRAFVERYGARRIDQVDDEIVGEWLAGGKHNGTVPALRAMFNDAASAKAGWLVRSNPFARLYGHCDHERALDALRLPTGGRRALRRCSSVMCKYRPKPQVRCSNDDPERQASQRDLRPRCRCRAVEREVQAGASRARQRCGKAAGTWRSVGTATHEAAPRRWPSSLCELRPRRGDSDWRAVYRRVGVFFVILAIDRHKNFAAMVERAQASGWQVRGPS